MGVCNSPESLQSKMNKMFRGLEFIQAYINDLIIISKGDRYNNLEKLELTLKNLKGNGLNPFLAGFQMVPIRNHELNYLTSNFRPKLIHGFNMAPFRKTTNDRYFNLGAESAPFHRFWFHHSITWTDMYICVILPTYPSKNIGSKIIWQVFLLVFRFTSIGESWDTPELWDVFV